MKAQQQYGITIVEFMVALFLGTILTAGMVTLFVNNKASFQFQNQTSQLESNSRLAVNYMARELRMAGYQGCTTIDELQPNNLVRNAPAEVNFTADNVVRGYEAISTSPDRWRPNLPAALQGKVVAGTDVLMIRRGGFAGEALATDMSNANDALTVPNQLNIQAGNIILITDCVDSDLFKATSVSDAGVITHDNNDNTSARLSKAYKRDAQLRQFVAQYYFIQDTGRTNRAGQPIHALYSRDHNGNETEIAQGVENIQLIYGIDTDNDGSVNTFQNARQVNNNNNWANVMSVRIVLLASSVENINPQQQSYQFDGNSNTATTKRMYKERTRYIRLRNRGI